MQGEKNKKVIIVAGPTAVGKTAVAVALAGHFRTEIISADSRQCYTELNIGVARPSPVELQQVKHHFVASHSVSDEMTAAGFENYALEKTTELFRQHEVVILAGGTGLYVKAFCEGLDAVPAIDPEIRMKVITAFEKNGLAWLQEQVKEKDPGFFETGEIKNPQRLMRALEVIEGTGNSILYYRKGEKIKRDFSVVKIGLELPMDELTERINSRVDRMMETGLLDEVKKMMPSQELNALQTVGYKELFDHLHGILTLEEAVERIKINTRQYAKRQLTWFRKDKEIKWFHPGQLEEMIQYAQ